MEERIYNCLPSVRLVTDWDYSIAYASIRMSATPDYQLPASHNLHKRWWKIQNQGNTGACVGFALADSVLRWHFVQCKKIIKSESLSTRFIWIAAKETDQYRDFPTSFIEQEGTSLKSALQIAQRLGVVRDRDFPDTIYMGRSSTFYANAARLRISSFFFLHKDFSIWRKWIFDHGPILVRLEVDSHFASANKNTVLKNFDSNSVLGSHAVAVVGFEGENFIIRNSYGINWGNRGFVIASQDYLTQAVSEAFGVTI